MDARLKYLTTAGKIRLYYEFWVPENPKAIIVFLHGLGDHTGRYGEMIRYFATRGFGLCLFDQRGSGKSGGRRAHCRAFADFLRDLAQVIELVRESHPSVPMFLMGHSFGGQVAINFVSKYAKGIRGLIALSPNIETLVQIPKWKKKLAAWASKWLPIIKMESRIDPADFSHDANVVDMAKKDPLMNWHVTARLGNELLKNMAMIQTLAFQVKIPCLFMHGSDDRICSIEATRKFWHNVMLQKKDFKVYPGMYHELLNETLRNKVFADIESWIDNQLASFNRLASAGAEDIYGSKQTLDLWHNHRDHNFDHSE